MEIKLYHKDIKNIAENKRQGGGSHTALEVCLARKVLELREVIGKLNKERNDLFYALYSIRNTCNKTAGEAFDKKRKYDLSCESKNAFKKAYELDAELKKMG